MVLPLYFLLRIIIFYFFVKGINSGVDGVSRRGQAFLIVVIGENGRQEKHPHAKAQRRKGAEMKNIKKTMTTNLSFLKK